MKPLDSVKSWQLCTCKQCRGFPREIARSGKRRAKLAWRKEWGLRGNLH